MSREQLIQALWGANRSKLILLTTLLVLIFAVYLFQAVWFQPKLALARTQLQQAQSELRITQKRISDGGGAKISGLADDLDQFYQIVPQKSGLGSFIGRLYSYANDAGIDIAQISYVAKPVKQSRLLGYQLSFGVVGSYSQVKKFVHLLENSPSVLILDRISLTSDRQKEEEVVALHMQLQTFFREGSK